YLDCGRVNEKLGIRILKSQYHDKVDSRNTVITARSTKANGLYGYDDCVMTKRWVNGTWC
ncbi:MAG: hypothetical protein WBP74_02500, partial [Nitrososphaeraceae archaeon]